MDAYVFEMEAMDLPSDLGVGTAIAFYMWAEIPMIPQILTVADGESTYFVFSFALNSAHGCKIVCIDAVRAVPLPC